MYRDKSEHGDIRLVRDGSNGYKTSGQIAQKWEELAKEYPDKMQEYLQQAEHWRRVQKCRKERAK